MQVRRRTLGATVGGAVIAMALSLAACSSSAAPASSGSKASGPALNGTLNGSGSTFQLTYQQAAIQEFKQVQPGMTVNYGGGGSGKGRTDLASGVVNYAGSDSPVPAADQKNFNGKTVLYFPVVIGPVTMSYNLSGVKNLKLTPEVIAGIFQGKITNWNNPAIAAINPGAKLPSDPITTAVRSDSSGTTQNFSLYLQQAAPSTWTLGSNSIIKWPGTARAGNGNGGVASIIKSTPGAIGYVDYADAKASGLSFASVKNKAGNYVAPSPSTASAAADSASVAPNLTFHAVNSTGANAYPITYQSWVLVLQKQSSANTAKLLQSYVGYLVGNGQKLLPQLGYAQLPSGLDQKAKSQVSRISG
jgi:phosphate transport system substrate-binding protein